MVKARQGWDEYFLQMSFHASTRATCDRLHVGCVLVREKDVLATGYNGSISGLPHCDDVGHDMDEGHCVATVHAEMNALCMAARNGHSSRGATAYVTHLPCWLCFKLLAQAGIARVVYGISYRPNPRVASAAAVRGIELVHLENVLV
ncbi:MAG: deaminase [Deltaproteobacteria bacterium CG2_30_63_29]|nr:MAG: deaminase [Deltaproteobacteria bacterium CG2_30_63_29]PIV99129.1 MAG: deaminase [Deltaproteobacteria bacterium CG17_big_fil_post_rev_8_21_14_2_50_63_7]PJB34034.1 MAG: deaminase [Deltaproteobacteria bacterium CG_4_9_14_3_um_filter_63_12]